MQQGDHESAVSEVVAVILLVAVTVILSAIIAAFTFGLAGSAPVFHSIAITVGQFNTTHIAVSYGGGPDQKMLTALNITWPSGVQQDIAPPRVGDVYTAVRITPGNDRVLVVGRFTDNRDQVLLDTLV